MQGSKFIIVLLNEQLKVTLSNKIHLNIQTQIYVYSIINLIFKILAVASRHLLFSLLWGSELLRDKLLAYFNLFMVGAWLKEGRTGAYTVWAASCFWNRTMELCIETRTKMLMQMFYAQRLPLSFVLRKPLATNYNPSIPILYLFSKQHIIQQCF